MLTRRTLWTMAAGLGVIAAASDLTLGQRYRRGPSVPQKSTVPIGACDAHVHVIGDPRQFPMSADRDYTPPPATADQLLAALNALSFDRVVIVTPTIYGTDNSATLAAITQLGRKRARGVALVDNATSSRTLDLLMGAGIAGIRLLIFRGKTFDINVAKERLRSWYDLAEGRGWHLDISAPPDVVASLLPQLNSSPVPFVLDYFGWAAGGVQQPGFDAVLSLVRSGRSYIKLAEPYRLSNMAPDYPDLVPVVQALVAANPDRILWGSGWPHVDSAAGRWKVSPNVPVKNRHLLRLFETWVPDVKLRRRILVDNPARLYDF